MTLTTLVTEPAVSEPMTLRPFEVTAAKKETYDTWTLDYERDGIDQNNGPIVNLANNGLDDNDNNQIDDAAEAT